MAYDEEKKIEAAVIFEILGRPPEHLTDSLSKIISELNNEKGIKVKESKIHEPTEVKENKELFTTFADLIVEVDNLEWIVGLMFKYMPAHIEIISPEKITLGNNTWNEFLNELARRLHRYDEVARVLQAEKTILENKVKSLTGTSDEASEEDNSEA